MVQLKEKTMVNWLVLLLVILSVAKLAERLAKMMAVRLELTTGWKLARQRVSSMAAAMVDKMEVK